MKSCPYCAEEIQDEARICRYCRTDLASGHPVYEADAPSAPPPGSDAAMRLILPVGRSVWAIAAGYFGLFSLIICPAPIALIVSIVAIRDLKRHPDLHGMGRAIFGLVMGILGTLVILLALAGIAMGW